MRSVCGLLESIDGERAVEKRLLENNHNHKETGKMRKNRNRFREATGHGSNKWGSCGGIATATILAGDSFCKGLLTALLLAVMAVMLLAGSVQAADFVIVVDVSGSMADRISRQDKRVRVAVVQEALRQYLPALPPGSRVNLVAFNSGIVSEQEVILKDESDLSPALAWVDGLAKEAARDKQTYLWTTLRHALKTASTYSQQNPDQPVTVRVLTDGEDNEHATTLDKVLQEFLAVLDGEKIRSNLVLLGDMEFKTKLSLPEGAFETTKNPTWEVLFPPIVLWAPAEPKIGEEVRLFENNTKAIYKDYQWQVDGIVVGQEKVLAWQFKEPRIYRVTLKVTGLQGTQNAATVLVRVNDEVLTASIKGPAEIVSGRAAQFAGEITGPCASVEWQFGDGTTSVERNPQHTFQSTDSEYKDYAVTLRVVSPLGKVTEAGSHTVRVWAEKKIPAPQASFRVLTQRPRVGDPIQIVDETTGPVESVLWEVDGESKGSVRNPEFVVSTPGEKTVRMTVRGPGGESVATKKITIQPRYAQPVVWCGASKLSGTAPLTVQFTNRITGDYKSLVWTFGDGQTSTTNGNPTHTFVAATNYAVTLTVYPLDVTQPEAKKQLAIKATTPWPLWAKAAAVGIPVLILLGVVAGAIRRRRRIALRLPVYYFAEQAPVCRTLVLTNVDEAIQLTPAAPLRIRREGNSRNLTIEPMEGATLFNADSQEVATLGVGDGIRVTVRDANGILRAVAVSSRQKPSRPTPAMQESGALPADGICGLHNTVEEVPSPAGSEEFDWGWDKASTKVG